VQQLLLLLLLLQGLLQTQTQTEVVRPPLLAAQLLVLEVDRLGHPGGRQGVLQHTVLRLLLLLLLLLMVLLMVLLPVKQLACWDLPLGLLLIICADALLLICLTARW